MLAEAVFKSSPANTMLIRKFFEIAASCYQYAGLRDKERSARLRYAETYVQEADLALARRSPSYLVAASFIGNAIASLREVTDTEERRNSFMHLCSTTSSEGTQPISHNHTADVTDLVSKAESFIEGKSLSEVIAILARVTAVPSMAHARKFAEEASETYIAMFLFPSVTLDGRGKGSQPRSGERSNGSERQRSLHSA